MGMVLTRSLLNRELSRQKSKLTDEELFTSDSFAALVTSVTEGVSKTYGQKISAKVEWLTPDDYVAFVAGMELLQLNANNALVQGTDRQTRYRLLMGLVLHECGHRLFTDFPYYEKYVAAVYRSREMEGAPKVSSALKKLSKGQMDMVMNVFHSITNIIEDAFIELVLMRLFPGYGAYLSELRDVHLRDTPSLEGDKENGVPDSARFFNALLSYAKFGVVKADSEETLKTDPVAVLLEPLKPGIDAARVEKSYAKRIRACAGIFEALWDVLFNFKEEEKPKESGSESDGSGKGSGSDASGKEPSDESKEETSDAGTEESEGKTSDSSEETSSDDADAEESEGETSDTSEEASSDDADTEESEAGPSLEDILEKMSRMDAPIDESQSASKKSMVGAMMDATDLDLDDEVKAEEPGDGKDTALERLADEISEQKALDEINGEAEKKEQAALAGIPTGGYHEGQNHIWRKVPKGKSADYGKLEASVKSAYNALCKQFSKQIRDRLEYSWEDGLFTGQRLVDATRRDLRRFANRNIPEDDFDMAISLYIDLSGSMHGEISRRDDTRKWEIARKTAFLMASFCKSLGIPLQIVGHDYLRGVRLVQFKGFDTCDNREFERISRLGEMVWSDNRDGYGLRVCAEALAQRREKCRLLFVISDGEPFAPGYFYREAKPDIDDALTVYGRKGIRFITAGMGDCGDGVRRLYQEGLSNKVAAKYLDITDVDTMPRAFVNIIKKYLDA